MKTVSGFSQRNPYSPIVVSKLWLSNLSFHFRLHSLAKNAMPKQLPQDNEPKLQTNTYTLNNKFTKPFGCHPKKNCATLQPRSLAEVDMVDLPSLKSSSFPLKKKAVCPQKEAKGSSSNDRPKVRASHVTLRWRNGKETWNVLVVPSRRVLVIESAS